MSTLPIYRSETTLAEFTIIKYDVKKKKQISRMCTQIMAGVANMVAKWELAKQQIPTKFSEFWLENSVC